MSAILPIGPLLSKSMDQFGWSLPAYFSLFSRNGRENWYLFSRGGVIDFQNLLCLEFPTIWIRRPMLALRHRLFWKSRARTPEDWAKRILAGTKIVLVSTSLLIENWIVQKKNPNTQGQAVSTESVWITHPALTTKAADCRLPNETTSTTIKCNAGR